MSICDHLGDDIVNEVGKRDVDADTGHTGSHSAADSVADGGGDSDNGNAEEDELSWALGFLSSKRQRRQ